MQRTLRQSVSTIIVGRRSIQTSTCWCQSSSSTPYSLPHDAFTTSSSPSSSTPTSSSYSRSSRSPLSSSHSSTPLPPTHKPGSTRQQQQQRQKQFLTDSEAQAFADLLGEILPKSLNHNKSTTSSGSKSTFDIFAPKPETTTSPRGGSDSGGGGIEQIQTALEKKLRKKSITRTSNIIPDYNDSTTTTKTMKELTATEEIKLDELKEIMNDFKNDYDLYLWSLSNIFGLPSTTSLFIDPSELNSVTTIPNSKLYPSLLLHLFCLLRDQHSSPHTALRIFSLACSNANSYILGCTSKLYYEVLITRWKFGNGDFEGVLQGLEEMRSGGVRIGGNGSGGGNQEEEKFKDLVEKIGETIRNDREITELQVQLLLEEEEQGQGQLFDYPLDERERERLINRKRYFGEKDQIRQWRKMEKILEDHLDQQEEMMREKNEDRWRWEERQRGSYLRNEFDEEEQEGEEFSRSSSRRPSLYSHRPSSSSSPSHSHSPPRDVSSPRTHLHPPNRRNGLSTFENVPKYKSSIEDQGDERDLRHLNWKERDELRGLPKRPSFANIYKIQRKSLTKEEKSRKDDKHPMLFWKQK